MEHTEHYAKYLRSHAVDDHVRDMIILSSIFSQHAKCTCKIHNVTLDRVTRASEHHIFSSVLIAFECLLIIGWSSQLP